ncbi:RNA processing factor [Lithospermum erythrorhizon]|uniref:RNA processing factor n=1 Tax=Lithospermum erythrorhizon TaxID=34254 RepID=A0AAV3PTP5_LITER
MVTLLNSPFYTSVNSLFYNINTNSVEDFTERGISDLKSGKIVTPLPPKQTFLDDPLRVLRAIRFGARFGFILDEDLKLAAADDDVRAAIAEKISRERVGHEIGLMISGNQPTKAMMYVEELHLFWSVFSLPSEFDPPVPEKCDRLCVSYMRSTDRLLELIGGSFFTDDQRRLCLYSALFLPFRHTVYRDKKKKIPVVSYIFRNSLKLKSSDAEAVINLHKTLDKFLSLMPFFTSEYDAESIEVSWKRESADISSSSKLRVLTGLLLIDIKEFWRVALVLSVLLYPVDISCSTESAPSELVKRTEIFKRIEDEILKLGLENVWEMKPLLNGKDIMNILDLKTGGPVVREWQQRLLEWQLAHPSATSDACIDWMKESCSKRSRTN